MDEIDDQSIPLSALQHGVYCLRQAALIHLERLWAENRFTAEGQVQHQKVHEPGQRRMKGVRRVHGLHLASRKFGISGVADLVEFRTTDAMEVPFPVEFKRGKPKLHRADEVQLCAQALCLEEMTGVAVPEGALFYALTKRRVIVPFDEALRHLTVNVAIQLREIFTSKITPPAVYQSRKCNACSLMELCKPKANASSAKTWRERRLANLLEPDISP